MTCGTTASATGFYSNTAIVVYTHVRTPDGKGVFSGRKTCFYDGKREIMTECPS